MYVLFFSFFQLNLTLPETVYNMFMFPAFRSWPGSSIEVQKVSKRRFFVPNKVYGVRQMWGRVGARGSRPTWKLDFPATHRTELIVEEILIKALHQALPILNVGTYGILYTPL